MKCVKTKGGEVKRIADKEAQDLVRSGEASFVPRHEWKKVRGEVNYRKGDRRPGGANPPHEEVKGK